MPMSPRLLRPISTTHPEAQVWRNAVIANGGTVSGSTLNAVSKFCRSIDAAGIRDKFLRLNLFCGNSDASLNAVRTPLYRGQSRTGPQVGNTTDTNANFVAGDYAETGSSSGLKGDGSTKSLNTGVKANDLTASDSHLGFGLRATQTGAAAFRSLGGAFSGSVNTFEMSVRRSNGQLHCFFTRFGTPTDTAGEEVFALGALAVGDLLMAWPSFYRNGTATGATASTSQNYPSAHDILVFALNNSGTSISGYTDARINWYSIGRTMTSAQALSFYNAIAAFNTALTRT
jgi:hypothetical protein